MNDIVFKASENEMKYYTYLPEGMKEYPGEIVIDEADNLIKIIKFSEKDSDGYYGAYPKINSMA
ncbi:MAG: hypothetical protein LBT59_19680 [Clostridiales bacterium]|jgi:hypothetical protein|nr:hypothetical protein [Clostridiales bacterium]